MKATECDREPEVLEAVLSECWPVSGPGEDDLRSHAELCPVCADVASVAALLRDERDDAWREARVPTSGQVWWRAAMRRRAEATAAAARPITMLQGLFGVCAAGMCAALITLAWPSTGHPFDWMPATLFREGQRIGEAALWVASAALMNQALLSLAVVAGAGLILSSFVLYFALSDD